MSDPQPGGALAPSAAAPFDVPVAPRNPGMPLELDWVEEIRINRSAVERRAATQRTRRTVKKQWQAAWLLRAITLMDLTTLAGDDTPGRVRRLCAKARRPVRADLLEAMGAAQLPIRVGAVCVYHSLVETAVEALEGSGIPVAAVSTGFPAGLSPFAQRIGGDPRIGRGGRRGDRHRHHPGARADRRTGARSTTRCAPCARPAATRTSRRSSPPASWARCATSARASLVCMMAGADFIKTSTGKESVNATLPVGLVMVRAIRDYRERTGQLVGFKPAGGIRAAKESLDWLALMKDELGDRWLRPDLFRFGASSLLTDIERQLEHFVTGRYSAAHRHPAA